MAQTKQTEIWEGADYKSCVEWVSPFMVYYKEAWKIMFVLQNLNLLLFAYICIAVACFVTYETFRIKVDAPAH